MPSSLNDNTTNITNKSTLTYFVRLKANFNFNIYF